MLFHDSLDFLRVDCPLKLSDDNYVLRIGWIILDFRERLNARFPFTILHNYRFAEVVDRGCSQKLGSFLMACVKVVVLGTSDLD